MACIAARTGRHQQRYDGSHRLVSGCIPYRLRKKVDEDGCLEDRLEVLMISSPNRHDLIFPKGGWEIDETVEEAACREALEEAGVKGLLKMVSSINRGIRRYGKGAGKGHPKIMPQEKLGLWEFRSKSSQNSVSLDGGCRGCIFALEVTEELEMWPEQENHDRKWLSIKEAFKHCRYEWMREALEKFVKVMALEQNGDRMKLVTDPAVAVLDVVSAVPYE